MVSASRRGLASLLSLAFTANLSATDMGMGSPPLIASFSVDRLETQVRDGDNAYVWDTEGWLGRDINKFVFKSEGEYDDGEGMEDAELQLLYGRAILPFWDLRLGLRHDFRPNPSKTYAVVTLAGDAPYNIEVEASVYVSEDGDTSADLELEYDLRLTQRWILQPRAEFDFGFSQVSDLDTGRGPGRLETGLRLRYEVLPEFAPYAGFNYETALGNTRSLLNDADESRSDWSLILGLTAWF